MTKRIRHNRHFWVQLIAAYEDAGRNGTHRDFAERHGVGCGLFRRWLYRLRDERRGEATPSRRELGQRPAVPGGWPLVEVQGVAVGDGRLEVELGNGRRVIVPASFDAEALRRLLAVVAEPVA
jgi:hypothetical protein